MAEKSTHEELEQRVKELTTQVSEDTCAQVMTEEAQKIHGLLMLAPFGVFLIDLSGKIIVSNEMGAKRLGKNSQEIEGTILSDYFPSDIAEKRMLKGIEAIRSGNPQRIEDQVEGKWYSSSIFPLKDNNGKITSLAIYGVDVTEVKKGGIERERILSQLQATLEATVDGIIVVGLDEKIKVFSKRFKKNWNMPDSVLNSKDANQAFAYILDLLNDSEIFLQKVQTAFTDSNTNTFDTLYLKDGRVMETYSRPQKLNDKIIGRVWGFRDISDRDRAEKALKKSEEKYKTIIESIEDGYYEVDIVGNFTFFNNAMCEILGYSKDELSGMNNRKYMDGENSKKVFRAFNQVYKTGRSYKAIDWELIRKDGSKRYVETSIGLKKDSKGQPTGFQGIARDITERKRAEDALQESEERLRTIFDVSSAGIILVDLKGVITYANQEMARMFGCTQRELVGSMYPELVHPDQRKIGDQRMRQLIDGEIDSVAFERHYIRLDGTDFWGFLSGRRHEDDQGNLVSLVGIIADITKQKTLENELRQSKKMEALGTLSGGIAHEFNNILGIIIGNTELAIDDVPDWNPAKDCLKEIQQASLRAKDVVRRIMSFSRMTPATRKPIKISTVIQESLKLTRAVIPANIEIQQEILCVSEMILANPTEIIQVLINLCSNSLHAMEGYTGILKVRLESAIIGARSATLYDGLTAGKYVKLTVKDNGIGIDSKIMGSIFDPYFTTKDVDKGLGMGLAVVYGIVKKHDGAIKVMSEVGNGTTVEVLLPVTEEIAEILEKESDDLPTGTERILFVDDEVSLVKLARQILERQGYVVVGKTSSTEALKLFQEESDSFDLVISDMAMPKMPGDRLAQELIRIRPTIPIIICTGHSDCIDENKVKELGIKAYNMKPFVKMDLIKTVRKVLDESKAKSCA